MAREIRQTKIVFTIGPATVDERVLTRLIERGVSVCRVNMAHAEPDWFRDTVDRVRACGRRLEREIALLMDVKGPEVRTRDVREPVPLEVDDLVELVHQPTRGVMEEPARDDGVVRVGVSYPHLARHLEVRRPVLIDGTIRLVVEEIVGERVRCRVVTPGTLESRRHVNLPGTRIQLDALTRKDVEDVRLGVEAHVDFFALSFVHEARDVHVLRALLGEHGSPAHIIAKIENASGVEHLDAILAASDGIMVARGDLGIEMPFEQLPTIQRRAVEACIGAAKPVIVATQMLESMIESSLPTRAEITDVSNAVRERADCVMLSGETSIGRHPERCVEVLNRVITWVQHDLPAARNEQLTLTTPEEKMLRAAVVLAEQLGDAAILVFTRNGDLVRLLAAQRPTTTIFAFTDVPAVVDQMRMLWGVEPFLLDLDPDPEQTISNALTRLTRSEWLAVGDRAVVITNVLGRGRQVIDSLQIRTVE